MDKLYNYVDIYYSLRRKWDTTVLKEYCTQVLIPDFHENGLLYIMNVELEGTEKHGIIGFGVLGEEIYREIPMSLEWELRLIAGLFNSPGFKQMLLEEELGKRT